MRSNRMADFSFILWIRLLYITWFTISEQSSSATICPYVSFAGFLLSHLRYTILSKGIALLFSSFSSFASFSSSPVFFTTYDFRRTSYVLVFTCAYKLSAFAQVVFSLSPIQAFVSSVYRAISPDRSFLAAITWFSTLPSLIFWTIFFTESERALCFSCLSLIRTMTFQGLGAELIAFALPFSVRC